MQAMSNLNQNIHTVIICISDTYLARGHILADFYAQHGESTLILTPDFSHSHKKIIEQKEDGVMYLHHRRYSKNLSWQRIYGHIEFAKLARQVVEQIQPQRIHCLVPANSLAKQMDRYKKDHPQVELIFDINDLWPESLPIPGFEYTPFSWYWKNLRNHHVSRANHVFVECQLFHDVLQKQIGLDSNVLYWSRKGNDEQVDVSLLPELRTQEKPTLSLCYLGSANNIIDLAYMKEFLEQLSQKIKIDFHVIANGAKKQEMMDTLKPFVHVIDHGLVYDAKQKQDIFRQCHFGLNMMKSSVCIGLSMKSIDYLEAGLPILNTLQGDLHTWIEQQNCGINLDRHQIEADITKVLHLVQDVKTQERMRMNARTLFEEKLSLQAFYSRLETIYSSRQK